MIALFKSQFSIGKSILTLDDILGIQEENSLKKIVLVEDSFYGFRAFNQACLERDVSLIFGIKLPVVQRDEKEKSSKLIFFAKNNQGVKDIKNLYTKTYTNDNNVLVLDDYSKSDLENIKIAVPFYDSYIYNNLFYFGMSNLVLNEYDHFYLEENNNHPFDFQIKSALKELGINSEKSKSIYYKNKDDFHAFQMYKAVCGRSQGKSPTFGNPNLNHFCSDDFCWESYKEQNKHILFMPE
jgi:DNA polymerase III alpha subunit